LLGDFGAAGLFDVNDIQKAHALQRLEVCALGHLLAELLAHGEDLHDAPENTAICQALQHLSDQCCNEVPQQRPLFADITAQLSRHLKAPHTK
jgi:hypothetical protein